MENEGYEQVAEETEFLINLKIGGGSTHCHVVQNENLEFVEFRYPDIKWIIFNVKRAESTKRDIRFTIQSIRDSVQTSDPVVMHYCSAEIIRLNGESLSVTAQFVEEVDFVHRKVSRKFKKPAGNQAEGAFQTEVHLVKTKEYRKRSDGSFPDVMEWKDEVVIQPQLPDTRDKEACSLFMKEFIKFCFNIEAIC